MAFAFEKLNLRFNPFGEPTPQERMALAVADTSHWVEKLKKPGYALQFMGDAGRGKSTHLHAIRRSFEGAPFTYLGEGERFVRIPKAPVVFVDEVQRLHPVWRHFLFGRRASFVLATHEDLTLQLQRAGLEVETHEANVLNAPAIQQILNRRIQWARATDGAIPSLEPAAVEKLKARFGTDLRAMEDHLYDVFQELDDVGPVDPKV